MRIGFIVNDIKTEQVEFVELHNPTGDDVDVSGWYFSNGDQA